MCGIAGYVGNRSGESFEHRSIFNSMAERGPDCANFESLNQMSVNAKVHLFHRRLSIIDLDSRSNQPFKHNGNTLIFNGEIYNYLELRKLLKQKGVLFRTNSDTEVLAMMLEHYGIEALNMLEGMWAFSWYNNETKSLLLSRDRFGEKPLFIYDSDDGFYFASKTKTIEVMCGKKFDLNFEHSLRYLINGYKSLYKTKECFIQDIFVLPPGSSVLIDREGTRKNWKYWSPSRAKESDFDEKELSDLIHSTITNSVRIRTRADVPIGFCLSGGIDSNSLVAVAQKELGLDIHAFTIKSNDERYDETELVDAAVNYYGCKHSYVNTSTNGFIEKLSKIIGMNDAPVATLSYFLHWTLLQKMAAYGIKISISGTGADELFTGYYDHHNLFLGEVSSNKPFFEKAVDAWERQVLPFVRNEHLKDPYLYVKSPDFRDHIYNNNNEFCTWLVNPWSEEFHEVDFGLEFLRNRMMNEMFHEVVPPILFEDDRNAMFFSMENRSPFLDSKLFELALSIPTKFLIKDGIAKQMLRSAMSGLVCPSILNNRRKMGFNASMSEILSSNPDIREYALDDSEIFDFIKKDKIEEIFCNEHLSNTFSKFLFSFINLKMFMENR